MKNNTKKLFYILIVFFNSIILSNRMLELRKLKDFSDGTVEITGFSYLQSIFDIDVIIETGTYNGISALKLSNIFKSLYTVELSEPLYNEAKNRLNNCQNVHLFFGDSAHFLKEQIPLILGKKLIFLDAHSSGGKTVHDNPILRELRVLAQLKVQNCIILIDDARGFPLKNCPVSLEAIHRKLKKINPSFTIISYGDAILAYDNAIISSSEVLLACTKSLFFDIESDNENEVIEAEKIIAHAQDKEKEALLRLTFPESAQYHLWRGLIFFQEGNVDKAKELLLAAYNKGLNHTRILTYIQSISPE